VRPPPGPRVLLTEDRQDIIAVCPSRQACIALARALARGIIAMPPQRLPREARELPGGTEAWPAEQLRAWAAESFPVCSVCEDGLTMAIPPNGGTAYCHACGRKEAP
jgi:hypothetical protein